VRRALRPRHRLPTLQRLDFLCGQARGQQVDIADPVVSRGVDDVGFAREDAAIDIERDQVRVGAVRDVLDQPGASPTSEA
jgi:hypothetical protein